jgi:hypothetical protein
MTVEFIIAEPRSWVAINRPKLAKSSVPGNRREPSTSWLVFVADTTMK